MISHPVVGLLDEPTISPAVYSGAIVVTVVTVLEVAVEPELLEQPIMAAPKTRKILKLIKILADFSMYYHYSAGY
jgi:hypothetical protein